jgi:DNA integrity scanning protein DisA with diadenylate cyclase activity
MNILTRSIVRHAHAIARESSARAVMLSADVIQEEQDLAGLIEDVGFRVILVTRREGVKAPEGWGEYCQVVRVPDVAMTRAGQIKVAVLVGASQGLIAQGDRIVCVTGLDRSGTIDTVIVLDLGHELEMFGGATAEPLPSGIEPAVFQRLLTLASELGLEGREGRPVGTLFVVGDPDAVFAQSRQLVMNPFQGYPEDERNVMDPRLEETIKEFSAIDGAFIVRGDGVLLSAGRYLVPAARLDEPLPQGLGTRHEAAAAVTVATEALALCVSQSTGTVSIFRRGRLMADIQKPRGGSGDGL